MYTPKFYGTVQEINGTRKGVLDNPEQYKTWFNSVFPVGCKFKLEVKKHRKPRSTGIAGENGNQNGFYWSVCLPLISEYNGDNVNVLHEYFIEKFLPKIERDVFGKKVMCQIRSSDLNTLEFCDYVDRISAFVAEFGVVIPEPNKNH